MKKTLADYLEDGIYKDEEGLTYDYAESLMMALLGFCGCGMPEKSLAYILRGLELISEKAPKGYDNFSVWWDAHKERLMEHFKTEQAEYFFYYWCDKEGYTEHGGSVPGWLTEEGENLLSLLNEWNDLQETDEG